jgi:hypothetical protein
MPVHKGLTDARSPALLEATDAQAEHAYGNSRTTRETPGARECFALPGRCAMDDDDTPVGPEETPSDA